jgi:acyl-CoA thioesterase
VTSTEDSTLVDSEFDRGIALARSTEGRYVGHLDGAWSIGAGINGGLMLAACAHALQQALPEHRDPLSISAYYLSAGTEGAATFTTEVVRRGRSMSTGTVSLTQEESGRTVERVRALATFGDLATLPDDVRTTAAEPDLPDVDSCPSSSLAPEEFRKRSPLLDRFDLRVDPDTAGWAMGRPSGRGVVRGWFRMADGREPDPLSLLLAVDALPPVTFDLGLPGWAPTLELTAHVRAVPAPGWLKIVHATRNFAGGLLEEDAEVWDSAGRLVAQSRQLARAPRGS